MKLRFERNVPQDCVLVEPDGTIFTSFMRTGFIKAVSRTKFASGDSPATGAFSLSSADPKEGEEPTALHALVFVSEVSGQEKLAIIERFSAEEDAMAAWAMVQRALHQYVASQRRKGTWRTIVRYVGAPLLTLIVGMSVVRFLDSHNGSLEALNAIMRAAGTLPGAEAGPSTASQVSQSAVAPLASAAMVSPVISPLPASAALGASEAAPGLTRAMAAIHFGLDNQPAEKTLYVYSDPNCPACKQFEPHINDLAKDFSIYVLPVAYQGDDRGKTAADALCAKDQKAAWEVALDGVTAPPGSDCLAGYSGLKANMQQFESLGFTSTPRVLNGSGFVFAEGATARTIRLQAAEK